MFRQGENSSAASIIHDAWRSGRAIVPILAAGISAGSGFPLIDELRTYLLKVKFLVKYGVYRNSLGQTVPREVNAADPENHLSRYIAEFGWPDINQLDSELYEYATRQSLQKGGVNKSKWIDDIVENTISRVGRHAADIARNVYAKATKPSGAKWGRDRWRLTTAAQHVILEDLRLQDQPLAEEIQKAVWSMKLHPRADWSHLLMELTEGNLGLSDALFSQWSLRYQPSSAHVLLAHLTRRLGIRLLLTTNFDPFVEQAFHHEGLLPRVFDVGRDSLPPDPTVVKQALSVVKLHGSAYSLRVGERLEYALDETTRLSVEKYVPDDAVLLVIGFSGYERRMMQLVEHLAIKGRPVDRAGGPSERIVWMHWESEQEIPATVREFAAKLDSLGKRGLMKRERLSDAGEFLLELYQRITTTIPKSEGRYAALPKRIIRLDSEENHESPQTSRDVDDAPFHLFARETLKEDFRPESVSPIFQNVAQTPSVAMSHFVHGRRGFKLIWIDLEDHHTVAGVVTEIIDKMRVHDPDLPPLVLPLTEGQPSEGRYQKAVRFIHRALRRGRYILAFDSLEGFGREHTSHHGLPIAGDKEREREDHIRRRVVDLIAFLQHLVCLSYFDPEDLEAWHLNWFCCFSCDEPTSRHLPPPSQDSLPPSPKKELINDVRTSLLTFVGHSLWADHDTADGTKGSFRSFRVHWKPVAASEPVEVSNSRAVGTRTIPQLLTSLGQQSCRTLRNEEVLDFHSELQRDVTKVINSVFGEIHALRVAPSQDSLSEQLQSCPQWLSDLNAAFLMLSVFRRPRSHVAVHTILNEYLPPSWHVRIRVKRKWIQGALAALQQQQLLYHMPGGFFWIPHCIHEWTYKLLTEPVRHEGLKERADLAKTPDLQVRLAFLILIHSRIARFYYVHVFKRSADVNALFEFLYHRVSSLRYATLLDKSLRAQQQVGQGELDKDVAQALRVLFEFEGIPKSNAKHVNLNATLRKAKDVVIHTTLLMQKFLQALLNVVRRETEVMLTSASADTWLAWIDQLEGDLRFIVPGNSLDTKARRVNTNSQHDNPFDPESARLARAICWHLSDIKGKLLREKRAWTRCVTHRVTMIQALCVNGMEYALQPHANNDPHAAEIERLATNISDSAKSLKDHLADEGEYRRMWSHAKKLLQSRGPSQRMLIERLLIDHGMGPETAQRIELVTACLRDISGCLLHLEQEGAAKRVLRIARGFINTVRRGVTRVESSASIAGERHVEADTRVYEAAGQARFIHTRLDCLERDIVYEQQRHVAPVYEPWEEPRYDQFGILSPHYRDVQGDQRVKDAQTIALNIERERHRTRGSEYLDPDEFSRRFCEYRLVQAQRLVWLEHFEDALHALDKATNGLNHTNTAHRFLEVDVDFTRANALMLSADKDVRRFRTPPFDTTPEQIAERAREDRLSAVRPGYLSAKAKLAEAEATLKKAERLMQTGRRNTGQWRRLYKCIARLHIERLLLVAVGLEFGLENWSGVLPFAAEVHSLIRRGLEAIRGGWDCSLSPFQVGDEDVKKEARRDRRGWLSLWLQKMCASIVVLQRGAVFFEAREVVSSHGGREDDVTPLQRAQELSLTAAANRLELGKQSSFVTRWTTLNRSVGLGRFVAGTQQRIWASLYNDIVKALEDNGQTIASKHGLEELGIVKLWSREIAIDFADQIARCMEDERKQSSRRHNGRHNDGKPGGSTSSGSVNRNQENLDTARNSIDIASIVLRLQAEIERELRVQRAPPQQ